MYYKRNEPFRYTLGEPITAHIEIIQTNEEETFTSNWAEVFILDLSPNGMKIASNKDIHLLEDAKVRITFTLNETKFELNGEISWKKTRGLHHYEFGVSENNSDEMKKLLISELKAYSKKASKRH